MGRRGRLTKQAAQEREILGELPLRQHWQAINRREKAVIAYKRARRKLTDKSRPKCTCSAYPFPHRPKGGLCRHPDPPSQQWKPEHDWTYRPYRNRYRGILRQIARNNGLHPIKDRALIAQLEHLHLDRSACRFLRTGAINPLGLSLASWRFLMHCGNVFSRFTTRD